MIKKYVSLVLLKFLIVRGAEVCVMTTGTHYRGLPMVVQGLEIPCNLTATLPGYSTRDHMLLQKYLEIGSDLYVEPTNEEIIGSFLILHAGSGGANQTNSKQPGPSKTGRSADSQPKPRQRLDIGKLF